MGLGCGFICPSGQRDARSGYREPPESCQAYLCRRGGRRPECCVWRILLMLESQIPDTIRQQLYITII